MKLTQAAESAKEKQEQPAEDPEGAAAPEEAKAN
jgi:hypothetical protein